MRQILLNLFLETTFMLKFRVNLYSKFYTETKKKFITVNQYNSLPHLESKIG